MFNFLDINKNGWLSYKEFCGMVEEKRRKIDPFDYTDLNNQNRSLDKSNDQLNIFRKQASYDDYKKSDSNIYRPFFKTNKKMLVNASYDGYGMKTALSDNIRDVISYEYIREIESLQKKKNESLLSLKSCSHKRGKQTKGSRMRNEEIKRKMNELQNPNDDKKFIYKLKQFINVPSSDYIRNITKHQIRKRENEYSENDLKIEDLRNKSIDNIYTLNKDTKSAQRNTTIGFPEIKTKTLECSNLNNKNNEQMRDEYLETLSKGSKRSIGWHKPKVSSHDYGNLKSSINITDSVLRQNKAGSRSSFRSNDRYNDNTNIYKARVLDEGLQTIANRKIMKTIDVAQ